MTLKNIILALLVAFAIPLSSAAAGHGQHIKFKDLDKGKVAIDPNKAYILFTVPDKAINAVSFLKVPDEALVEEYVALQTTLLDKANAKWAKKAASWDKKQKAGTAKGERPPAPTVASLNMVDIAFFKPLTVLRMSDSGQSGDKQFRYFLYEVDPGDYAYYGPAVLGPYYLPMGTCYCMGTYQFTVKAGTITNLGNILAFPGPAPIDPALIEYVVPAPLAQYSITNASFRAHGKMNNPYHITIGRAPEILGIFGYDRDIPLDLLAPDEVPAEVAAEAVAEPAAPEAELLPAP